MVWGKYKVYYMTDRGTIHYCFIDTWHNDIEYAWRASGANVPHTQFIKAELVNTWKF